MSASSDPRRPDPRRPIRIGNVSGAVGDGLDQVYRMAKDGNVDAITADYLAEFNIAWKAIELKETKDGSAGYETGFLDQLAYHDGDAARLLVQNKIKVVHDGGALNPRGLALKVDEYLKSLGLDGVKIAWVTGDDLTDHARQGALASLKNLDDAQLLESEKSEILSANAYTGKDGIVLALQHGADIVICGRCTDASPVMGLACWWHAWTGDNLDEMAGALMAGHLIECGPYVTGGNFCGAHEIPEIHDLGFPIAEISHEGIVVITKPNGTNGAVTIDTCKAQLLYEIQGVYYLNPDVIAVIDQAVLQQIDVDKVRLSNIKGLKPPPTTKLAVCLLGGYQAELSAFCVGLDTDFKYNQIKAGIMKRLNKEAYTTISIEKYGAAQQNPSTEAEATVQIRMLVQAPTEKPLRDFKRAIFYNGIGGFCGLHLHMDWRTLEPRMYVKYFPALIPQPKISLEVQFVGETQRHKVPPKDPSAYISATPPQACYEPKDDVDGLVKGKVTVQPLGDLVFARSGDKGPNANVGFWVRDERAWPWLRAFMTSPRLIQLLGAEWKPHFQVERCEFPNLWAVHFVIRGILEEGVSSNTRLDGFAKSIGEFLRARHVDLPVDLLDIKHV